LPNIDTLGVRGGKIHTDEEFALLDSFTERAKLSTLLLLNYAAGNFRL
ncbi:MAG: acetylornithine deacetylase, partial [Proteobacteria bacterium]|nr:acetylornithine deacetylase [Pseudomonadota bacterium]